MQLQSTIELPLAPHYVKTPKQFHSMPDEYKDLTKRLMLIHAEGELTGADDYTQIFYHLAPNPYEIRVCCERAAEEVDHYVLTAKVLNDIGVDCSYMLKQDMYERTFYPTDFVRDIRTWMERGMFSLLGETVVLYHMLEFQESSYKPFAEIFPRIIREENTHVAHGRRIIEEACETLEGKAEAQAALDRFWPIALDLFGRSDSKRSPLYVKWGLRRTGNNELRERFIRKTRKKMAGLGLTCPDDMLNRKFV